MPVRRRESAINKLQFPAFDKRSLSRAEPFEASLNNQWNYSEISLLMEPFPTYNTSYISIACFSAEN